MKQRFVRVGDELTDDITVVVRGGDLDPDILYCYREGYSPEMLLSEFPTLNLALIHKVLGFYLESQSVLDAYLAGCEAEVEQQRAAAAEGPSRTELRRRLQSLTTPAAR